MLRIAILLTLATLLASAGNAVDDPATLNLIPDGSLEGRLGNTGLPKGWYVVPDNFSTIRAYSQPGGRTGERCLRIQSLSDWASVSTPSIKLKPTAQQSGEVWCRQAAKSGGRIGVFLNYFDDAGHEVGSSPVSAVEFTENEGPSDWQRLHVENIGSRLPTAKTFNFTVALTKPGIALFDDFTLYQSDADAGASLVANGDMELPTDQLSKVFTLGVSDEGSAKLSSEAENPHGGAACLHLTGKAKWAVIKVIDVDVVPGRTIRGTAWKRAKLGGGHIRLFAKGPDGKVLEKYLEFDTKPEWQETPWKLTPEQLGNATNLRVEIETHGEFDICYDDIAVWVE